MILITRPSPSGDDLTKALNEQNLPAFHTPMIDFSDGRDTHMAQQMLSQLPEGSIVIALSQQVMRCLSKNAHYPNNVTYLAIGKTTAMQLHSFVNQSVIYPSPDEISEALLALPELDNVKGKTILILRGNRGRQILVDTLKNRGANIIVCECYQRHFINYDAKKLLLTWKNHHINSIVITSQEILQRLYDLTPEQEKHWLLSRHVIVISQRLAQCAQLLGWQHITVAQSAQQQALIEAILSVHMKE